MPKKEKKENEETVAQKAESKTESKAENKEEKVIEQAEVVSGEPTKDDRLMASLAHILGIVTHVIAPLIIFLIKKDESEFIADNSREAVNFQITMIIFYFVGVMTIWLFFIGLIILLLVVIFELVFCIQGCIVANNGKVYKYPVSFRFIK